MRVRHLQLILIWPDFRLHVEEGTHGVDYMQSYLVSVSPLRKRLIRRGRSIYGQELSISTHWNI
jgi:hypothetical protein